MNIFRLLLFVLLGLFVRRLYLFVKGLVPGSGSGSPRNSGAKRPDDAPAGEAELKEFTEQDISDADFEEIP